MPLAFAQPWLLTLLPLALLPLFFHSQQTIAYSSLPRLPTDRLSQAVAILLRALMIAVLIAIILGLSGLFRPPELVERIGQGAQMVVLLDRSSSMDRPFAGDKSQIQWREHERSLSKGKIARQLLSELVARRNQDLYGMLVFSTNPIQVLSLTDKQAMVQAAIAAGNIGRGLAKTNLGDSLVKAMEFFADKPYSGSRIVLLVSDGGARLNVPTQERIENSMKKHRLALYWIYIRSKNSPGLDANLNTEQAMEIAPEQLLHQFFQDLGMPYRAYSAENPQALEQAIEDVNRLQSLPIKFQSLIAKKDLSHWCYAVALVLLILLIAIKTIELTTWQTNAD